MEIITNIDLGFKLTNSMSFVNLYFQQGIFIDLDKGMKVITSIAS